MRIAQAITEPCTFSPPTPGTPRTPRWSAWSDAAAELRRSHSMRCVVVGTSGSGKSVLARAVAQALNVPHIELDELHRAENWTPRPLADFAQAVKAATQGDRWIADGNYSAVRSVPWPQATHIVWLNFSRRVVFARILRRTVMRCLLRQRLWHGNRESIRKSFFSRESIVWWSVSTHAKNRGKYAALRQSPEFAHLVWVELAEPDDARLFIENLVARTHPPAPPPGA